MTTPPFSRVSTLGQGAGLYPWFASTDTLNSLSVNTSESAEQDTEIDAGVGVLWVWFSGGGIHRIIQYDESGLSAGSGLPAVNQWPYLRVTSSPERYFALYCDLTRRFFRLRSDSSITAYWIAKRI